MVLMLEVLRVLSLERPRRIQRQLPRRRFSWRVSEVWIIATVESAAGDEEELGSGPGAAWKDRGWSGSTGVVEADDAEQG